MVRSMVTNANFPLSLWSEAIKTMAYVLNRVPTKVVPKTPFELWKDWKPSLRHVHVWDCPVEGYKFYCPSCDMKINDVTSGSNESQQLVFKERHNIEPTLESSSRLIIFLDRYSVDSVIQHPQQGNVDITLRRSTIEKRHGISSDYVVYLQEYDIDIGVEDDPITFSQAVGGSESTLWYNDMEDEMNSMANNQVWILLSYPKVQRSLVVNGF
ncbi:hypothetical protein AAG906_026207 [Vitis piasezkii]